MTTPRRRTAGLLAGASAIALVGSLAIPAEAAPQLTVDQTKKTYIVQMEANPVASYDGGTSGIPATTPAEGEKLDADSANARAYADHLIAEHDATLRAAGVTSQAKKRDYTVAFNGFTVELNPLQADMVKNAKGVVNVWEDEVREATTVSTPDYLDMTGPHGVWARQFARTSYAGRGMVIGVIDSGIDPDNPSFAPMAGAPARPSSFACDTGADATFTCTNKIVGARYYGAAYGNNLAFDHDSPRDTNGHGSHTAGTAAGNHGVPMSVAGTPMGKGSGMAPAAQISVYKALWQTADGRGSGMTSGLVAAIDDAVADGVDVINYSVSGSRTHVVSPDELAFLNAARAGVFVATSAGNSGDTDGVSSVAHNSPWTMTVAASTHDRGASKTVTLGNGQTYAGVGLGPAVGPAPLVLSSDIAAEGASAQAARECWLNTDEPTLDPAKAAGKIVICDRGTVDRVDKSAAVKLAGGVGMIQVNTTDAQSLNADFHSVPSIHVTATIGRSIKAYEAADANPTATLSAVSDEPVDAPSMAGFSSYGPALAGSGDLLKPDITAPGVDVIAAYSADAEGKPRFDSLSGTSMSAPHIAGLGALMKQKFPKWSPMAIKSAMMTTARQTTDEGKPITWTGGIATPFNYGAGEVVPLRAYNPAIIYDSREQDWYAYACSIGQLQLVRGIQDCNEVPRIDPSDLNYPSIAIGSLAGSQTVTRTVTNVTNVFQTYRAQVDAPAGTTVTVSPSNLRIAPQGTATFTVTITRTDAALGQYTHGALTWVNANRNYANARSPIAVRPVALATVDEVIGSGTQGSVSFEITPGFNGSIQPDVDGLLASTVDEVTAVRTAATPLDGYTIFEVAPGTRVTRVATYSDEVAAEDIDLNVYRLNGNRLTAVGGSGNVDSTEEVTLRDLAPGIYVAAIDVYSPEPQVDVPVHVWNLNDTDAGNMTVEPSPIPAAVGKPVTVTARWSGLDANNRYLGQVNFPNGGTIAGSTLVTVNP